MVSNRLLQVAGLGEVVKGPFFNTFAGRLLRAVTRENDDRQVGGHFLKDRQNFDPVHVPHLQVDHGRVKIAASQKLDGLLACAGSGDVEVPLADAFFQHLQIPDLVVHQKQADLTFAVRHGIPRSISRPVSGRSSGLWLGGSSPRARVFWLPRDRSWPSARRCRRASSGSRRPRPSSRRWRSPPWHGR